jgi:hypothetical protein
MVIGSGALLDAYIEWEREFKDARRAERYVRREKEGRQSAEWWASSLGRCYWTQLARRMGKQPTRVLDAQSLRTFEWGGLIEGFLRKIHYRCGIVKGAQTYLMDPGLSVSAKLDLVVGGPVRAVEDIPVDPLEGWSEEWVEFLRFVEERVRHRFVEQLSQGRIWAKEIKSAKSYKMQRLVTDGADFAWQIQVGACMLLAERQPEMLEEAGIPSIDVWVIEAIGRDAVGCITFGGTHKWRDEAHARLDYLNWAIAALGAGTYSLGDVPCECHGWLVEYCDFGQGEVARDMSDSRVTKWTVTFGCCGGRSRYTRAMRKEERRV